MISAESSARLPTVLTSFVGRRRELDDITRLAAAARLVTLTGAAGCGKTRLALRAVADLRARYPDSVYWVSLAQLADPPLVAQAVAKAIGASEQAERPLIDTLLFALRDKAALLVLDNCEHLLHACAQLAETLLAETDISILATSREALGVAGEHRYPLAPMTLPPAVPHSDDWTHYDAIQLFVQRAAALVPHFALTADNAPTIAEICRQLDGIPLAIELASARVDVLTLAQIAARLDDRFRRSAAAPVTYNPHQTLHAAVEWSYNLLSASEQTLLRRLSVFAGGCSLATVEAVCAGDGITSDVVLDLLSSLVNKSLVVAETTQQEARYRLLEMIRQFAQAELIACDEWGTLQDRHLAHTVAWVEAIEPKLYGEAQIEWFDALEREHDNLRAALSWALESGRIEAGLRIGIALYQFWDRRGYVREGFSWFDRLIDHLDDTIPLEVRVKGLTFASFLAMFMEDTATTSRWSVAAIHLCEAAGAEGEKWVSFALAGAVGAARLAGDAATAYAISERILELDRQQPDNLIFGMQVFIHGWLAIALGKYDVARAHLEEAMGYARQSDDDYRKAIILNAMGDLARCEGRAADAIALYEQGLARFRQLGTTRDIPATERALAYAHLRQGDTDRAHALWTQSLLAQRQQDYRAGMVQGVQAFAAFAAAVHLHAASARLRGFVDEARKKITIVLDPTDEADKLDDARYAAAVRAALGDDALATATASGRALSLQQAVDAALSLALPRHATHDLTEREGEIAALIARGMTNGEIAAQLVVSKRTVEKHIANILSKLALTHRVQIVRWVMDQS